MVFVLSSDGQPLDPYHPARARKLLTSRRAAVFRRYPFTIRLKNRIADESVTHPHRLKLDPGSKATGIAVVVEESGRVVWTGELTHRGQAIRKALLARLGVRQRRRARRTRYRPARFLNRRRPEGWLAPSLAHRVETTLTWANRLRRLVPVAAISTELVRFDIRLRAAGFTLEQDALNRWRATHEGGLITAWADDLHALHGWLLATVQRPTPHPTEATDEPATT